MNDKIICLVGPSGTGKTTIAKELEKLDYNIIHSYTTREPREENEWGHTFIDDWLRIYVDNTVAGFENIEGKRIYIDDMIAYREIYGIDYFATKEQYKNKGTSIYVVCPDGAKQVRQNVKDVEVITIFLMTDENIRFDRIRNRHFYNTEYPEGISVDGLYNESKKIARGRLEKDKEIFKMCKCDYAVDANRELLKIIADIINIIGNNKKYE